MFGGEKEGGTTVKLFGGSDSSNSSSDTIPNPLVKAFFPDDPVCAECCPNLTYTQRLIGFCTCAGLGYVLSLVGTLNLIGGFSDENVRMFAILYVGGNIIALCATGFLLSPKKQCINMWKPTRRFTTAFYLVMLIAVLVVALIKPHQSIFLVLFLLFIEVLAAIWYSASYIPFGRDFILSVLRKIGICFPCFAISDALREHLKPKSTFFGSSGSSSSSVV